MLMLTPAPRRAWKVVLQPPEPAASLSMMTSSAWLRKSSSNWACRRLNTMGRAAVAVTLKAADSQLEELLAELPSCSPAAQEDVPMVAGLSVRLSGRSVGVGAKQGRAGEPSAPTQTLPWPPPPTCEPCESLWRPGTEVGYVCGLTYVVRPCL
jgi:hypothetical protein